jgi:hypothetical protein
MSHGAIARPNLSTSAVVLAVNDLEGSVGLNRDILGFGSDWARRRTGAAERDGMDPAGPAARRRQTRLTAGARCCGGLIGGQAGAGAAMRMAVRSGIVRA